MLEYDAATGEIVTKFMGDVQDRIGKPVDSGQVLYQSWQICTQIGRFVPKLADLYHTPSLPS